MKTLEPGSEPLRVLLALGMLFGAAGLVGCNTTQGLGEDVEATGDAIEEAAEDIEDDLDG